MNVAPPSSVMSDYVLPSGERRRRLSGQEYLNGIPNDVLDAPKRVLGEAAHHRFGFSVGYGESPVSPANNPI